MDRFWPIADMSEDLICKVRRCSLAEAQTFLAVRAKEHEDPVWLDATLARLSVPALAVLAVLAERSNVIEEGELSHRLESRFGLEEHERMVGVVETIREALVVPLLTQYGSSFTLVTPAAKHVIERVQAIDCTPLAEAPFETSRDHDGGRSLIAVCALLAQVEVRATKDGMPHRGSIKRMAKQIAIDETSLDQHVLDGLRLGIVETTEDSLLRVDREILASAARHEYPHHSSMHELVARLRAGGPCGAEIVERWTETVVDLGGEILLPMMLSRVPGIEPGLVAGARAYRASELGPSAPAVTITPSFEVFVPPEVPLTDVAKVLGVCEPVRLDRVIVARLTKASVGRAVAAGSEDVLRLLASVTRTPVPQNVAAAVQDWSASQATATLAHGQVIVVAAADETRATAALAAFEPRILAPGVLLVDVKTPARAVSAALAKAGLVVRDAASSKGPSTLMQRERAGRSRRVDLPLLPSAARADLAARVVAYRAGETAERSRVPARPPQATARSSGPWPTFAKREADPPAYDAVVEQMLLAWEDRHEFLTDDEFLLVATCLGGLTDVDRKYVLKGQTASELVDRVARIAARRSSQDAAPLTWIRDHIEAHLEAAARTQATCVLDLGERTQKVKISSVHMRGKTRMVFGEDEEERSVAIRFDTIRAIAEAATPARPRWRPIEGEPPPAGHVWCPCGSGERYRSCCREPSAPN